MASLEDQEYLHGFRQRIIQERERLYGLLQTIPFLHRSPAGRIYYLQRRGARRAGAQASLRRAEFWSIYYDKRVLPIPFG